MKRATYINLYFIIHHISLSLSLKKLIKSSNLKLDLKHLDSMLFLVYISIIYRPKRGREKGEKGKIPSRFDVVPYIPIIYKYCAKRRKGKGKIKSSNIRIPRCSLPESISTAIQRLFPRKFAATERKGRLVYFLQSSRGPGASARAVNFPTLVKRSQ